MREKTIWFGTKRDIHFEINRFKSFDPDAYKYSWSYYLYLSPDMFDEKTKDLIKTEIYYTAFGTPIEIHNGPISDLEWHGGLTWASEESSKTEPFKKYKFGCDFQHLWDMHKYYELEDIENSVSICIDSLYSQYPNIKTLNQLWDEFRKVFPGEKCGEYRRFDINGKPIEETNEIF